jgi:DMSO/TMAO reductase YedYZ molybdopterin-dependent catalytic subunit
MDESTRLTKTKEQWAKARRGGEQREVFDEGDARLPPGQHLVETFPVLDLGFKPEIPLAEWKITIGGFVANPITWNWEEFLGQPQFKDVSDFHCVTSWSRYDNEWEGVSFKHIISVVKPSSLAKFVLFKSYDDYTTNPHYSRRLLLQPRIRCSDGRARHSVGQHTVSSMPPSFAAVLARLTTRLRSFVTNPRE